jgi:DMSO/TMAO reductase YedYZ molybdopterin-dependent catalytic subunit
VTGVLAAAVAAGAGQLAAGLTAPAASPLLAVGQAAIDSTPQPVKDFAISSFGTDDKHVLLGGIVVVLVLCAAVTGMLAVRRLAFGLAGLAVLGCLGLAAALTRPTATAEYAVPTLAGAAAGGYALAWLARKARLLSPATAAAPGETRRETEGFSFTFLPNPDETGPSRWPERRRFLVAGGTATAAAAVTALAGRELITWRDVGAARAGVRLPAPAVPAPPLPPGSDLRIEGLSSFITPNGGFYRVDTTLLLPQVDPAGWQLRIHGMVRREVRISFDELLRMPLVEDYVTLACVSDPVGGPYIGNARWLGARLADLIRRAGPLAGADQLLCTSADGFTSGTPLQVVLDGRDALLAVAMNGQPLPVAHGFPARMVVPGLYGYVSATKWVTDIEVTTFATASGYWVRRGWAQQAPVKTECRIDVPAGGASLAPGPATVAGVAWAQHKGVDAVEVRVDGGPWQQARLGAVPGIDTWRQWALPWDATPGGHVIEARATDATGYTQTGSDAPPEPNGATGYPRVNVRVH